MKETGKDIENNTVITPEEGVMKLTLYVSLVLVLSGCAGAPLYTQDQLVNVQVYPRTFDTDGYCGEIPGTEYGGDYGTRLHRREYCYNVPTAPVGNGGNPNDTLPMLFWSKVK